MPHRRRTTRRPPLTARTADKHDLYQRSVQFVDSEIDFVDRTFRKLRGRSATLLREDFCGTANTSCEWARRRRANIAVGVDLDAEPLGWGVAHNLSRLKPDQAARVRLLRGNVLDPASARPFPRDDGRPTPRSGFDIALAMNFSYWCFKARPLMLEYFRTVRRTLKPDGVFFLDHYGGSELATLTTETRRGRRFTYIWDQADLNPITGEMTCYIHFRFPDGTKLNRAFTYDWRTWSLPELRDLLAEAGFARVTIYWEGDDDVFRATKVGEPDRAYITYIVAER